MARLFHDGFEYNNTVANYPWTINGGGAATYVTTTVRNGTYSGQISGLVSGTRAGWLMQLSTGSNAGPFFARFYINITTLPSASNTIFSYTNGAALSSTQTLCVKLNSDGTLGLYNLTTQIGANGSTVLSTGTWYMIEVKFDASGGAAHGIGELKINGVVERTSSTLTYAVNTMSFMLGGNLKAEAQTVGKWFLEDVAINDSSGVSQTGYPGPGNIVRLKPNATGDNNQFVDAITGGTAGAANNYTRVNTVALNSGAGVASNGDKTSGRIDDFNMDDTPAAIDINSIINAVTADLAVAASDITGAASIRSRIKKTSGGTVSLGTAFVPPSSLALVVNKASAPWVPTLVLYNDPDGAAWTKTTLDSMQAGYSLGSTTAADSLVTNISVQVDYTVVYAESATISNRTTVSSAETTQYVQATTITTRSTLSSLDTRQSVESSTISSRTTISSIDSEKSVESTTISNRTSLYSTETERSVESASVSSRTTLIPTAETAQYVESAVIGSHSTLFSSETVQDVESNTITSRSTIISADSETGNETNTCTNKTSLTSSEFALFTESTIISTKTALSSSELYTAVDTNICNSKTTVLAGDIALYVESATCSSTTTFSPIDMSICTDRDTTKTITIPSGIDTHGHTNVGYFDNATITSTTTLISFEAGLVVELVGYAINRYTVSGIDTHYRAKSISHFKVQAGI